MPFPLLVMRFSALNINMLTLCFANENLEFVSRDKLGVQPKEINFWT